MIVDAHTHLGVDRVFDEAQDEATLIGAMDRYGIDVAVVQPFVDTPTIEATRALHDRIAALSKIHPGRIFGMVSLNPHLDDEVFKAEVRRCVQELHFVAVKLTTIAHACSPLSRDAHRLFALAGDLGVPVMVHTGVGVPFALPSLVIPAAREFPDLTIILAYAGNNITAAETPVVAELCPNVVFEPSWVGAHLIQGWIRRFGADRIMFGSDMVENYPAELAKYRGLELSPAQLDRCLSGTAIRAFQLPL